MAEGRRSRHQRRVRGKTEPDAARRGEGVPKIDVASDNDATERQLARFFALGMPMLGLTAALVVASAGGLGPAILVLAGTALLGTIGFFWASLRTLSGDAPLPEGMLRTAIWSRAAPLERKREALRALKDLELEHSMGKIDDADYQGLSARYRETAKTLMRAVDAGLAPRRVQAESLVESYLRKRDLGDQHKTALPVGVAAADAESTIEDAGARDRRLPCGKCGTGNDLDAAFCKKCGAGLLHAAEKKVDASA